MELTTSELSPKTYSDFEELATKQGSCWCTYYQRPHPISGGRSQTELRRLNRQYKRTLMKQGKSHAILVYHGGRPVGWCQYGIADELPRIDAGRGYKKVGRPEGSVRLWRITCFFVDREHRNKGVSKVALHSALESIRDRGGGIVEAYPVVSKKMAAVPEWRWFGTPSIFLREHFKKVALLGNTWVLMRRIV